MFFISLVFSAPSIRNKNYKDLNGYGNKKTTLRTAILFKTVG